MLNISVQNIPFILVRMIGLYSVIKLRFKRYIKRLMMTIFVDHFSLIFICTKVMYIITCMRVRLVLRTIPWSKNLSDSISILLLVRFKSANVEFFGKELDNAMQPSLPHPFHERSNVLSVVFCWRKKWKIDYNKNIQRQDKPTFTL